MSTEKPTIAERADHLRAAATAAQKRQEARTGTTTPPRSRHAHTAAVPGCPRCEETGR